MVQDSMGPVKVEIQNIMEVKIKIIIIVLLQLFVKIDSKTFGIRI